MALVYVCCDRGRGSLGSLGGLRAPRPAQNFENWAPRSSRAWRLRERPTEVTVAPQSDLLAASEGAPAPAVDASEPLSGLELAQICFRKYGKYHDLAIKHARLNEGVARWVALNVYVGHLGQRSFPYTEQEYLEKACSSSSTPLRSAV